LPPILPQYRLQFHPQGRDNGYVLTIGDTRVYLSGDTEDVPEMRALKNIDVALLCVNPPFTMDIQAAANSAAEFKPAVVPPATTAAEMAAVKTTRPLPQCWTARARSSKAIGMAKVKG